MNSFGQRLLSARKISGLSLQELADKMNIDITKQAISQYEKGQIQPSSKVIIALTDALDLPADYFFRKSDVKLENIEFRKESSLSQKQMDSVRYKAINYLERYLEIEDLLNIENTFKNLLTKTLIKTEKDVEKYASELRKKWNLGFDPIPDVIALLEDKKLKIFETDAPENFSGLSSYSDGVAVIVVNNNKDIGLVRKRLTTLHELAHILLTFPKDMGKKEIERFCFSFAGAFFFPEEVFRDELGKKRTGVLLDELIILENYYGMSVQAIMMRMHSLGLISDSKFRDYNIWLNKSGYRKKKFGNFKGREKTERFKRLVLRALSEKIITGSKAAALLEKPLSELEEELLPII